MAPERSKNSGTPRTRTEKVHHALRSAIIEQRLAPGSRLPEDAIGESFGTSRTIAREALGRLAVVARDRGRRGAGRRPGRPVRRNRCQVSRGAGTVAAGGARGHPAAL